MQSEARPTADVDRKRIFEHSVFKAQLQKIRYSWQKMS